MVSGGDGRGLEVRCSGPLTCFAYGEAVLSPLARGEEARGGRGGCGGCGCCARSGGDPTLARGVRIELRREDAGGEVGDLEELGGGAAAGLLVDEVFAAVLGGVAADGGGGVVDVAVEDERQGVGALVELGGGGEPAAAGVGEFGLGQDLDGFVAGEIDGQGGDGGAESLGDVIDRAVGALEEIEQVLSLRRRWIEDVDTVAHCIPLPTPCPLRSCWASPARDGDCLTDRGDGSRE